MAQKATDCPPEPSIRDKLSVDVFNSIPLELQKQIKSVNKKSQIANNKVAVTTADKLWLFSRSELYSGEKFEEDEPIYSLFINKYALSNIHTDSDGWWTRSGHRGISDSYWYIKQNGDFDVSGESATKGIIFGFCI